VVHEHVTVAAPRRLPASSSWRALGTQVSVFVTEPAVLPEAEALVREELVEIDLACSRFRDDSELARVNRAAGRWTAVSSLFLTSLRVAVRAARVTDGDVDPTVGRALRVAGYDRDFAEVRGRPSRRVSFVATPGWRSVGVDERRGAVCVPRGVELDLGATAKALAADRAATRAAAQTGTGVLVNLGGDMAAAGDPPLGGWPVRVTDDHAAAFDTPGQTVSIASGGLATSSTTVRRWAAGSERLHHILDPRSGRPVPVIWRTVSVAARSCVDANIASTAAIVRGDAAPAWLESVGMPARLVAADGSVLRIGAWPEAREG
jgi:thiamine biosynthesis lipoprotein